jgi:hypothetical protein
MRDVVILPKGESPAGKMCEETVHSLKDAARHVKFCWHNQLEVDSDYVMRAHDRAVGHQVLCRYLAFGRSDIIEGVKQVIEEATRLGCPMPYSVVNGQIVHMSPEDWLAVIDGARAAEEDPQP